MRIGVIGGSGLYQMHGLTNMEEVKIDTPFGAPSDSYICGTLEGADLVFLARHGRGHIYMPSEVNYRANIYGMKKMGVEQIISVSAVGSLREELAPQDFVMVDQFVDRTKRDESQTFFGKGIVAHVAFADPTCDRLRTILYKAALQVLLRQPDGIAGRPPLAFPRGTYLNMEGPAFSTRAESFLYKSWGMDVIGMTNMSEARLAREAEICYATMAMVTDYDCWHSAHEDVTVEMIIKTLNQNAKSASDIIRTAVPMLTGRRRTDCACGQALATSVITARDVIPPETREKLSIFLSKYGF